MIDVDIRSVIRWEKNETLIKPEKEKDLVEQTFIPYQVIRNLNATVPIPVFYDFKIRKYSMSAMSVGLPDAAIFKAHMDAVSPTIEPITDNPEKHIDNILQFHRFLYKTESPVSANLILEAAKMLPELNMVMYDSAGYYAGHCVVFPVRYSVYEQIRARKMEEGELKATDLVNFRNEQKPVFYGYSVYADCNENIHYMLNPLFGFFRKQRDYLIAGLAARPDGLKLFTDLGLKPLWVDTDYPTEKEEDFQPTFMEGNLGDQFKV